MMARVGSPGKTCKMKKLIEEMRRTVRTTETAFFSRYLRRFVEPPPRHLVTGCPTLPSSCRGREVDSRLVGLLLVPSPNQQYGRQSHGRNHDHDRDGRDHDWIQPLRPGVNWGQRDRHGLLLAGD